LGIHLDYRSGQLADLEGGARLKRVRAALTNCAGEHSYKERLGGCLVQTQTGSPGEVTQRGRETNLLHKRGNSRWGGAKNRCLSFHLERREKGGVWVGGKEGLFRWGEILLTRRPLAREGKREIGRPKALGGIKKVISMRAAINLRDLQRARMGGLCNEE